MAHMLQPPSRDAHRLFPADPQVRSIAADLYALVAQAPIISPHGHVPVAWLSTDASFRDPVDLFVTHDHYVTRQLHAAGVDPAALTDVAETDLGGRVVPTFQGSSNSLWPEPPTRPSGARSAATCSSRWRA